MAEQDQPVTVLIIDDDDSFRNTIIDTCTLKGLRAVGASTKSQGWQFFLTHQETLEVVVIDGCIDNPRELDSIPLINEIVEEGVDVKIVAESSNDKHVEAMKRAGAHYGAGKDATIMVWIYEILGVE